MFHKIICLILNIFSLFSVIIASVSDKDYALMPTLFELDNYDQCMLQEENALFCSFTFTLKPIQTVTENKIWNIIQNISANPRNYRHDRLRHGICVPTTCPNNTDVNQNVSIEERIELCYNKKYENLGLKGNISEMMCLTNTSGYPITTSDIIFGIFLIIYITFIIFASIYEGIARRKEKDEYEKIFSTKVGKVIASFSLIKNYYRLITPTTDADAKKLRIIQGIRFYCMFCVTFYHTFFVASAGPVTNPEYLENATKNPLNMFIANGQHIIQTFFVFSGWLLSFHFFLLLERRKSIGIQHLVTAFIYRYIRLTPALAIILAFQSTWMVHLGKGPLWHLIVVKEYENCRRNWWTNILYINNYVEKKSMCMIQTWYLASDTQLFLISLVLLMIVMKVNHNKIKVVFGSAIIVGILIPAVYAFVNNVDIIVRPYPETLYHMTVLQMDLWYDLYISSYSNISGYIIGLTAGYFFYKHRNTQFPVKKIYVALWWILSFGLCIFVILIAGVMYKSDYTYTRLESALYWAFGKNVYAFGVTIGILGVVLNIVTFPKSFCEWKSLQVLGRLTYSTYIVHLMIVRIQGGLSKSPAYIDYYLIIHSTLGNLALSYLAGTLLCLTTEMPITALQKMVMPKSLLMEIEIASEKSLQSMNCEESYNGNIKEDKTCTKV